ncbi:MAG: 5-deoxy-glucuronate isomerase [bacterium]
MAKENEYLIRFPGGKGLVPIVSRGERGLELISFDLLFLHEGDTYSAESGDDEVALVVLGGRCDVEVNGQDFRGVGEREDVFDGPAACVYAPKDSEFKVSGLGSVEIAVCKTLARRHTEAAYVPPERVKTMKRGRDNWSRTVHDIVDARVDAECMLVGETFSPAGNWSSAPPHRHEKDDPPHETKHEEIYYFRTRPRQGFGIIRLYNDDRSLNETYTVEHNDTVVMLKGYHPTVAGPGYQLYYLWILAGKERKVVTRDDPAHEWLKKS